MRSPAEIEGFVGKYWNKGKAPLSAGMVTVYAVRPNGGLDRMSVDSWMPDKEISANKLAREIIEKCEAEIRDNGGGKKKFAVVVVMQDSTKPTARLVVTFDLPKLDSEGDEEEDEDDDEEEEANETDPLKVFADLVERQSEHIEKLIQLVQSPVMTAIQHYQQIIQLLSEDVRAARMINSQLSRREEVGEKRTSQWEAYLQLEREQMDLQQKKDDAIWEKLGMFLPVIMQKISDSGVQPAEVAGAVRRRPPSSVAAPGGISFAPATATVAPIDPKLLMAKQLLTSFARKGSIDKLHQAGVLDDAELVLMANLSEALEAVNGEAGAAGGGGPNNDKPEAKAAA